MLSASPFHIVCRNVTHPIGIRWVFASIYVFACDDEYVWFSILVTSWRLSNGTVLFGNWCAQLVRFNFHFVWNGPKIEQCIQRFRWYNRSVLLVPVSMEFETYSTDAHDFIAKAGCFGMLREHRVLPWCIQKGSFKKLIFILVNE